MWIRVVFRGWFSGPISSSLFLGLPRLWGLARAGLGICCCCCCCCLLLMSRITFCCLLRSLLVRSSLSSCSPTQLSCLSALAFLPRHASHPNAAHTIAPTNPSMPVTMTNHFTPRPGAFASVAANTIDTVKTVTLTRNPADNAQSSIVCRFSNLLSAGGREENVAGGIAAVVLLAPFSAAKSFASKDA